MSDKIFANQIIDYFSDILPDINPDGTDFNIRSKLEWQNNSFGFKFYHPHGQNGTIYLQQQPEYIQYTPVYEQIEFFKFDSNLLDKLIKFLYAQLIFDIQTGRTQNEHIAPLINKLKSKKNEIDKIFNTTGTEKFWESNFVVINLNLLNTEMKKTVPLLVSKMLYHKHKSFNNKKSLTIIIDEAHNILSKESFREAESWKDYRLETFEEVIKEGRKFGVFVTISSQRPNDISATITSQAHNYFIHRLINQKDLTTISSAVSYIDKVTEESIPTLPTGVCIFSGVASQIPLKIKIDELHDDHKPRSQTLKFEQLI